MADIPGVNLRWKDNLLQLLAGVIGTALVGILCYQAAEIYAWRLQRDWVWQHYAFLVYLFCVVVGLIVGIFLAGLFLMIYRRSWGLGSGRR